jgi:hypothetical protein
MQTGSMQTYVTTFPDHRRTWPLTTEGGRVMSWSQDGKEILVATVRGDIVGYPVSTTPDGFTAGVPAVVLHGLGDEAFLGLAAADHSKVVIRTPPAGHEDRREVRLLFDWQSRMKTPR